MIYSAYVAALACAASTSAHILMLQPPAFRGLTNPFVNGQVDFNNATPLRPDGSDFPCRGYVGDFNNELGTSVADFEAGAQSFFELKADEAAHNGGSCQVSLSFDEGRTWKVIKSFEGNCVRSVGGNTPDQNQSYAFTIPKEARSGKAIFSWTWFNNTGNREMYQNCAAITIKNGGDSVLADKPDMFKAHIGNGCNIPHGVDVLFPNPGDDVEQGFAANGSPKGQPEGDCGPSGPPPEQSPSDSPPSEETDTPTGTASVISPPETATGTGIPTGTNIPAQPSPSTEPTEPSDRTYTVVAGDNCYRVSDMNGISLETLFELNPFINSSCTNLQIGQVVNLRRRSRIMRNIA